MKKTVRLTLLTVVAALLLPARSAGAALIDSKPTDGTIAFTEDTGAGEIIEPNPEAGIDEVVTLPPTEGSGGSGSLRIQFVPNFRFGVQKGITAAATERPAQLLTMMKADGVTAHGEIAPFVQVTDNRGLADTDSKWTLTAVATKFLATDHDLGESHIILAGSTLTTSTDDSAKAKTLVAGHLAGTPISLDSEAPTTILETKAGQSTNGYQVSNVFHDQYTKGMAYPVIAGVAEASTNGVKLHKAKNVAPRKEAVYTSTIYWTLTDGL